MSLAAKLCMALPVRFAIIVVFVFLLLAFGLDTRELVRHLRDFNPAYGWLAALVVLVDRLAMTYKWSLLLRAQGHRLPMFSGMKIYCASMLWGTFLPTTVGADAVRAFLTMQRGIRGADATASILVERMIGFVAALVLALVSLALMHANGISVGTFDRALYAAAAVLIAALALVALCLNATVFASFQRLLPRFVTASSPFGALDRLGIAYRSLETARGAVSAFTVLTLIEQLFGVTMTWILARGFGIDIPMLTLLAVVPIATLISRVPISIDGLGVYETAFAALLAPLGVAPAAAVAISLVGRAIQFLVVLPWWMGQVLSSRKLRPPVQA